MVVPGRAPTSDVCRNQGSDSTDTLRHSSTDTDVNINSMPLAQMSRKLIFPLFDADNHM